ncbi:MAG: transcription-repair coupling factor [Vampirovibrionales bacterium]|nr:transcription-repair coupling factor [Vampirovibrionales bacterium]
MTPPRISNKVLSAGNHLLDVFLASEWAQDLGNRFLRAPKADESPDTLEAYLENLANPAVKALILAAVFRHCRKLLVVVCAEPQHVQKFRFELNQLLPAHCVEAWPPDAYSPYDQSAIPAGDLREQFRLLARLRQHEHQPDPFILLLSPKNLLLKHPTFDHLNAHAVRIARRDEIAPETLTRRCLEMGYLRTSLIMEPGEFSSRGDIFDLYPINGDPVRIEFFGDMIETIRRIDVDSQRSVELVGEALAIPRSALLVTPENRQRLQARIAEQLERQQQRLSPEEIEGLRGSLSNQLTALEQEFLPDGVDYFAPLVEDNPEDAYRTLLDALPTDAIAALDDWPSLVNHLGGLSDRLDRQLQEGLAKGRLLDMGFSYHVQDADALRELRERIPRRLILDALPLATDSQTVFDRLKSLYPLQVMAPTQFRADLGAAVERLQQHLRDGERVFVTTDHPQRALDACKERGVGAIYWSEEGVSAEDASWQPTSEVIISKTGPQEGFLLPEHRLAHYSDVELFGRGHKRIILKAKSGRSRDDIDVINSVNDLRPGDYVVHIKHGIGRFLSLAQIKIDGETREYLTLQYSGTDKLHVPVDQVNQLSRYRGAGDKPPKLNRMGGTDWSRVKGKVQKSVANIARDLVALYARRAKTPGVRFDADSPWQVEMEEAFPYSETPDQWQAILDMKGDMESEKVMDRLICGDVGFGKTEVALRGLFKCALSGKQAAVLAPTTILAQQHFNTVSERFRPYPVRIGLLSRFRSPQEQRDVVRRLALGEIDVVIGTHRLLQKDIVFKDLGLLVIDEEQRFGVAHKEKIKQMRANIDVLTMSATPIPRTLYMSLSGVREMSLIRTAPTNRLPIQTFVGPYNPAQIRMAILQEMDRGGQVYFLHNRVQSIYEKLGELQALIPEARYAVGHGQMSGDDLETVMLDFANHQTDVLLCTTIIESGLDIPNVNTIVIDQANRFGLAQLYQIRGRVGRSDAQAYAYCYYDPEKILSQDARDRLRAIREFTTLGSGYQIAMRDLEIRGVGNILGAEQHGHMISVGFDLYCQMLDDSIQTLQGKQEKARESSVIDLNVTAFIPEKWAGDLDVKLSEYKRLADIDSELALEHIQAEWRDRFGDIPPQTLQLVNLVRLRIQAGELGIPLVRSDEEFLRITVRYTLQEWMALQNKLPPEIGRRARWTPGASSIQGSMPTLLIRLSGMNGDDQVAYLLKLFAALRAIDAAVADSPS